MSEPSQSLSPAYSADHLTFINSVRGRVCAVSVFEPNRVWDVSAEAADVLARCEGVKTVAAHAECLVPSLERAKPHSGFAALVRGPVARWLRRGETGRIRKVLNECVSTGILLSRDALLLAIGPEPTQHSIGPINTICITTLNQPDALGRCVRSYAMNATRANRRIRFVILDDERDTPSRSIAPALSAAAVPHRLHYLTAIDVNRFCKRLADYSGVDLKTIAFALLPNAVLRRTDGASKNALMLAAPSERYLQVDDDTECRVGARHSRPAYRVSSSGRPLDSWYFDTRDEALRSIAWLETDFIGIHERVLGHDMHRFIGATSGEPIELEGSIEQLLNSLTRQLGSRVRSTFTGVVGDTASDTSFIRLLDEGDTWERLVESEAEYHRRKLTREVCRLAPRVTFMKPSHGMAFAMGCDATELLPPFFPLGRSYEVAYQAMMRKAFADAYVAHLPYVVAHTPAPRPPFSGRSLVLDVARLRLPDLIGMLIFSLPTPSHVAGEAVFVYVGSMLCEWAKLPWKDFSDVIVSLVRRQRVYYLRRLDERLCRQAEAPGWWRRDVREQIETLERALASSAFPRLVDYAQFGDHSPEARQGLQAVVGMFGDVVRHWPSLVRAACDLNAKGEGLCDA